MTLRKDAQAIWQAGVDAVDSRQLVRRAVSLRGDVMTVATEQIPLQKIRHIEVVGAGKAGAGMVRGLADVFAGLPTTTTWSGWVNVPEDCAGPSDHVHLHAARPAGINEPRPEGVAGTQEILKRISALTSEDLCIVLISGGGSALLPAPIPGISLEDKLTVTRLLAAAGATIQELNTVRTCLSDVKGGGLLRHCSAGRLLTLIISDVTGDPIDLIASGPTVPKTRSPEKALEILDQYCGSDNRLPESIRRCLNQPVLPSAPPAIRYDNFIIGANSTAVDAAKAEAVRRGYEVTSLGSDNCGEAAGHGRALLKQLQTLRSQPTADRPACVIAGGETTVTLAPTSESRRGGRNQEVVLGAIADQPAMDAWENVVLLSGGTDGEDGPTDAAGAVADQQLIEEMLRREINPADFLAINNSYPFFQELDGLLQTGPTHTNVMDLAVGIAGR